jgi:hypothetical protein
LRAGHVVGVCCPVVFKVCDEGGSGFEIVVDLGQRDAEQDGGDIFLTGVSIEKDDRNIYSGNLQ